MIESLFKWIRISCTYSNWRSSRELYIYVHKKTHNVWSTAVGILMGKKRNLNNFRFLWVPKHNVKGDTFYVCFGFLYSPNQCYQLFLVQRNVTTRRSTVGIANDKNCSICTVCFFVYINKCCSALGKMKKLRTTLCLRC